MSEQFDLRKHVTTKLKDLGFKKKGVIFTRDYGKFIHLVEFIKSRFGPIYIVTCGVVHKDFDNKPRTSTIGWHLSKSLPWLLNTEEDARLVMKALDLEKSMTVEERIQVIDNAISNMDEILKNRWSDEEWVFERGKLPTGKDVNVNGFFQKAMLGEYED
ncbi:MAG: DUF4304 domain-containing protein [Armatimonadetes bacterium]|nr:DUF4304 domain-containing protein [Armatimonadota bacterium]